MAGQNINCGNSEKENFFSNDNPAEILLLHLTTFFISLQCAEFSKHLQKRRLQLNMVGSFLQIRIFHDNGLEDSYFLQIPTSWLNSQSMDIRG